MPVPPTTTEAFSEFRNALGAENFQKVLSLLVERLKYSPVIVFMGKTGAGKSSACNALFGQDLFKVSDVAVGTRSVQVETRQDELTLVDVPGVGEGGKHSKEYRALYEQILREGVTDSRSGKKYPVDAIIWLIKADDRALEIDKVFYDEVFSKLCRPEHLRRLTFAISQCDAISPIRGNGGWDAATHRPGTKQSANLDDKRKQIKDMFGMESDLVVDFSATELYNLDKLLERIVHTLPAARKPFVVAKAERAAEKEGREVSRTVNEPTKTEAVRGFVDTLIDVVRTVVELPPVVLKTLGKVAKVAWKFIRSFF